jgi:WD40 repeat protein
VHKDRGAVWSPEGDRILFYSTRAGGWDFWTVRADGSELRRLTDLGEAAPSAWSPNGREVTVALQNRTLFQVDASRLATLENATRFELPAPLRGLIPGAWSPDGRYLGGAEIDEKWRIQSVGALNPGKGVYRPSDLPVGDKIFWAFGGWLPDSRHFVARGDGVIALVDAETGRWRELAAEKRTLGPLSPSRDGRTLAVEVESVDGDVWLFDRE